MTDWKSRIHLQKEKPRIRGLFYAKLRGLRPLECYARGERTLKGVSASVTLQGRGLIRKRGISFIFHKCKYIYKSE